jgi:hypothetical protein
MSRLVPMQTARRRSRSCRCRETRDRRRYRCGGANGIVRLAGTSGFRSLSSARSIRRRPDPNSATKLRRTDRPVLRSECFLGLLPGISIGRSVKIRYRRGARLRAQGSVKLATPAQSFGGGLLRFVERVGKPCLKIMQHRSIGAIEPNDRRVAGILVIVPRPARCRDQVTRLHR